MKGEIVQGKTVLELGSGTGFLGILLARLQQESPLGGHTYMTDYNAEVLERCQHNLQLDCSEYNQYNRQIPT